jgi:hypothetical protein
MNFGGVKTACENREIAGASGRGRLAARLLEGFDMRSDLPGQPTARREDLA